MCYPRFPSLNYLIAAYSHTQAWSEGFFKVKGMLGGTAPCIPEAPHQSTGSQPFLILVSIICSAISDAFSSVGASRTSRANGALRVAL